MVSEVEGATVTMPMPPILVADLFPEVTSRLLELLRSLSDEEWHLPTVSSRRRVRDIASHLLDGSLRRLSMQRDNYQAPDPRALQRKNEPLLGYLNRLNDEWETGTRLLSPQVLTEMIEWADARLSDLFQSLDMHATARFPVAWAGETESENWMDVAREYTEKWHHTQQIFDAVGRPSTIMTERLGRPCLDVFMRALAFTFQDVHAEPGVAVVVKVVGEAGGHWQVVRRDECWEQIAKTPKSPSAVVVMDHDTAWKLVTKRRSREAIRQQFPNILIEGDVSLGQHVLDMVSVMA
jgi:hypothetical protein